MTTSMSYTLFSGVTTPATAMGIAVSYNFHNVIRDAIIPLVRSKGSPPRHNMVYSITIMVTAKKKQKNGGGGGGWRTRLLLALAI